MTTNKDFNTGEPNVNGLPSDFVGPLTEEQAVSPTFENRLLTLMPKENAAKTLEKPNDEFLQEGHTEATEKKTEGSRSKQRSSAERREKRSRDSKVGHGRSWRESQTAEKRHHRDDQLLKKMEKLQKQVAYLAEIKQRTSKDHRLTKSPRTSEPRNRTQESIDLGPIYTSLEKKLTQESGGFSKLPNRM